MYDLEQDNEEQKRREQEQARHEIFFEELLSGDIGRNFIKNMLRVSKAFTTADNPFPMDSPQLGMYLAREAGIRHVGGYLYETLKAYAPHELSRLLTEKDA